MSALNIARAILAADGGVSTLVGGRIGYVEQPQAGAMPAVVLTLVDEDDGRHLAGSNQYPLATMIADAVAEAYDAADALGGALKLALRDYRGTIAGHDVDDVALTRLDFFDKGEVGRHWRRRIGFAMRYRAAPEPKED